CSGETVTVFEQKYRSRLEAQAKFDEALSQADCVLESGWALDASSGGTVRWAIGTEAGKPFYVREIGYWLLTARTESPATLGEFVKRYDVDDAGSATPPN